MFSKLQTMTSSSSQSSATEILSTTKCLSWFTTTCGSDLQNNMNSLTSCLSSPRFTFDKQSSCFLFFTSSTLKTRNIFQNAEFSVTAFRNIHRPDFHEKTFYTSRPCITPSSRAQVCRQFHKGSCKVKGLQKPCSCISFLLKTSIYPLHQSVTCQGV